ncbi:hypothetical protein WNB94_05545 [Aquabacterium sp. A3]|uniref:hypothetical protein n=1 Tax=Aquabacterium sp. A3 TaxID=3132829 RepID=UPI0031191E6A
MDDQLHRLLGLYMQAPQWIKSSIGWAYARIPPTVRFGAAYRSYQDAFARQPTEAELQRCLTHTLLTAVQHVPGYRHLQHLAPLIQNQPREALRHFPLRDKTDYKGRLDDYTSSISRPAQRLKTFTGGSTSVPMVFFLEKGRTRAREWAAFEALSRQVDVDDGKSTILALRGRSTGPQLWMHEPIKRHLAVSCDHLVPEHLPAYADILSRWRPRYIHAYASALYPLLLWLSANQRMEVLSQVRGVLLTSESIQPVHLEAFRKLLPCPVVAHYGHSERVLFAHTDDLGRYHFWPRYGYFELVDEHGQPITQAGQLGEIVGTSYDNEVMPFIRYRTGDMAMLAEPLSGALSDVPVCAPIHGRKQEFVVCHDKRLISITTLGAAHFAPLERCLRIQYEQHQPGHLILHAVPGPQGLNAQDIEQIEAAVKQKTEGGCRVDVHLTDQVSLTRIGKQRLLLQHIDLTPYLGASIQNTAQISEEAQPLHTP